MATNSNYLISLFISFIFISTGFSQNVIIPDTANIDMFEKINLALNTSPKFYFSFDTKNSFISNRRGTFLGFKAGLEYQKLFRYGLGFNTLYNKTYANIVNGIKQSEENLNFNYLSIFAEYIFYKDHPKFELSMPINLGFGYSWLTHKFSTTGYFNLLYEAQLNGMYFPLKFIGVGAGVGYRLMLINNPHINEHFTAPIYSFRAKLILGKLFHHE